MSHSATVMSGRSSELPSFPPAQQAQIIRSNQRDLYHVSALREQVEGVLRSWLGTRWLTRWDKEVELGARVLYYGLAIGQASQSLGEEYTDIWLHSAYAARPPTRRVRLAVVLLPTLPSYLLARFTSSLPQSSVLGTTLRQLPGLLEVLSELNLAIFYFRGVYYDLAKRLFGARYISSTPQDPNARPPTYSLLGILLGMRLLHRLISFIWAMRARSDKDESVSQRKRPATDTEDIHIDDRPVSSMIGHGRPEDLPLVTAEQDERTILDFTSIPVSARAGRNCTLCLEERTATTATECGHLFCWDCIVGWGREKAECPLCRQSLSLTALLPVYNL